MRKSKPATVGSRMAALRALREMSQRQLAEQADMEPLRVYRLEKDRGRGILALEGVRIAEALGVSLTYLLTGKDT